MTAADYILLAIAAAVLVYLVAIVLRAGQSL